MLLYIYSLIITIVLVFCYNYISNQISKNYWKKHGVPFYSGKFGFGLAFEFLLGRRSQFELVDDIYKKYKDAPVVVTKVFTRTALIINDLENIQSVMATDFNCFNHRGFDVNADVDLLADNVLFMIGNRWKLARHTFTPLFTAAKLRNMHYILNKSAQDFVQYLKYNDKKESIFDSLTTFSCAAISATVFGIGTESTMESPFLDMARKAFAPSYIFYLKLILRDVSNRLFKLLKIQFFFKYQDFFIGAMKQVLQARRQDKAKKYDFADLCIGVQSNGVMRDPSTGYEIEPTDEFMSAQAFFFFVAGAEPSACSMFFTLFELAKNPHILSRVHREIDELFERSNGDVTYENIIEMEYLDRVIDEAMRIHPPVGILGRKCIQKTIFPVGNVPVESDFAIRIPVFSIHHNPKYYPNPEVFDPERFTVEAKQQRPNYTYMAFGEGHRTCLGMRYARLQMKTGIAHLLKHFTVKTDHANTKIKYTKSPIQLRAENIDFIFVNR